MTDDVVFKSGPCGSNPSIAKEEKLQEFNDSNNIFLGVGGIPSTGWEIAAMEGHTPTESLSISDFTSDSFITDKGPFEYWISPFDKRAGDEIRIQYPKFSQNPTCAGSILQYGQQVEAYAFNETTQDYEYLPSWLTSKYRYLSVNLADTSVASQDIKIKIKASLPQDPNQSKIEQEFDIKVHNPCNSGNKVTWVDKATENKGIEQSVVLVDWSTKEILLEGLFTSQLTLDGDGDCIGFGGKFGKDGSDFVYTFEEEVEWAKISDDNKLIFVESKDVADIGNHILTMSVSMEMFPSAEPLVVEVPITIKVLKGNGALVVAYTLLPIIGVLALVAGFFGGCYY
jgi:hypothetical protein